MAVTGRSTAKQKLSPKGFEKVGKNEEWRSCYFHPRFKVFLIIYVDDFKMAGPEAAMAGAWGLLREGKTPIAMGNPTGVDQYLGCKHIMKSEIVDGRTIRSMTYDMESFLESCISVYVDLAGPGIVLKDVSTPFLDEDDIVNPSKAPSSKGASTDLPLLHWLLRTR